MLINNTSFGLRVLHSVIRLLADWDYSLDFKLVVTKVCVIVYLEGCIIKNRCGWSHYWRGHIHPV